MGFIEDKLRVAASGRKVLMLMQEGIKARQAALEQTPEWAVLQTAKDEESAARQTVSLAEDDLRAEVAHYYEQTSDKKPANGVEVKLFKKLVYDQDEALKWCSANAPALVEYKLAKEFDKVAEKMGAPVKVEMQPRVQIAGNLDEWLTE